jgi:hypothetical protein
MKRTFITICLSCLAALVVPSVLAAGIGLWTGYDHVWRLSLETLPLSFMLGGLTVFFWLCGPPKPSNLLEAIGRWFLALLMPTGMAFIGTALPALFVSAVDHTQLTSLQNFWIGIHVIQGLLCGVAAGVVLQCRESVCVTSCGCSK